jgi:hypothetical protein
LYYQGQEGVKTLKSQEGLEAWKKQHNQIPYPENDILKQT